MRRVFNVRINEVQVGQLAENEDGRVSFRFFDEYRKMAARPVLSQYFEDDLLKVYRGKRNALPAFFANLVPEGQLREVIERSINAPEGDDLAILAAVGHDLPGAVEIEVSQQEPLPDNGNGHEDSVHEPTILDQDDSTLRFSLAGVQMKFSVVREREKLTLPAHNRRGEWIVKLDSARFPNLVENEFATMEWARTAGFDVPECYLQPISSLAPGMGGFAPPDSSIFVIRRYDRVGSQRIHQEDFAQVVGLPPRLKYEQITYEQCASLVRGIVGEEGFYEFIRRLVFMVASGNVDAHLKNWSFIYPDGIQAQLAPLYDQVVTIAWPSVGRKLSLNFASTKHLHTIDEAAFVRFSDRVKASPKETIKVVRETLERIASAWRISAAREAMPREHTEVLREYWKRAPLLAGHSDALE